MNGLVVCVVHYGLDRLGGLMMSVGGSIREMKKIGMGREEGKIGKLH